MATPPKGFPVQVFGSSVAFVCLDDSTTVKVDITCDHIHCNPYLKSTECWSSSPWTAD